MSEDGRQLYLKPMTVAYQKRYLLGVAQRANMPVEHLAKGIEAMAEIIESDTVFLLKAMDPAISERLRAHREKKGGETFNVQECFDANGA